MDSTRRRKSFARADGLRGRHPNAGGLTLAEVLVALVVITIGLVGVAGSLVVASGGVSGGINRGQGAVERGYAVSTATLLAEQWIEQIRMLVPTSYRCGTTCGGSTTPVDNIGNPPTGFATQAFGTIANYPNFSRSVTVQTNSPGTNMKTVTVTVRYRYASGAAMAEEGLGISTIIAARP